MIETRRFQLKAITAEERSTTEEVEEVVAGETGVAEGAGREMRV